MNRPVLATLAMLAACLAGCSPNITRRGGPCLTERPADFNLGTNPRVVVVAPGVIIISPFETGSDDAANINQILMSCGKRWCAGQGAHQVIIGDARGTVTDYYVPDDQYYGGVSKTPPYVCRMVDINRGGDIAPTSEDMLDALSNDN